MNLVSYKNDINLKNLLIEEVKNHRKMDMIVKGSYGKPNNPEEGFCAIGCSIHSLNIKLYKNYKTDDYSVYEKELGIPEWLARLEDTIFENLPYNKEMKWPEQFLSAIPVGVNLEPVKWKFCSYLMNENIKRVEKLKIDDSLKKQVLDAIKQIKSVHDIAIKTGVWDGAESATRSAESAAWSAARSAAWSAESAARSAESAMEKYSKELLKLLQEQK